MKIVSKMLVVSALSAGLMTTGRAMIDSNEEPNRFAVLASLWMSLSAAGKMICVRSTVIL